jgi:hypothetical protein
VPPAVELVAAAEDVVDVEVVVVTLVFVDEELDFVEVEEEELFTEDVVDETGTLEDEELTTTPPGPATEVVREPLSM